MIIAAIVISVLSIMVSGYSFVMTRRTVKARRETERLRAERMKPVITVDVDTSQADAMLGKLSEQVKRVQLGEWC